MSFVYSVRCNFAKPEIEDAWNEWYNGPKLAKMISKPLFESGQRYTAAGMDETIKYLALWVVDSPDAFTTPEYRSDWGFFEWAPHITDWSRDLYSGYAGDLSEALDVGPDQALYFLALDGVAADQAEATRSQLEALRPGLMWLQAVGLDLACPCIAVRKLAGAEQEPAPLGIAGVRETIYRPISPRRRSPGRA